MAYVIVGVVCFAVGAWFGILLMSCMAVAKRADDITEKHM